MKKKVLFAASVMFIAWAATSCEELGDCGKCKTVTYEDGSVVNSSGETEYCGSDLIAQKAKPDVTIGNQTTKTVCR